MIKKILVFGAGYVGSSLSVLLAKHYQVILVDINQDKVKKINLKQAPIDEPLLENFISKKSLNLLATTSYEEHLANVDIIILALPTNYNEVTNFFDTSILELILKDLSMFKLKANIVIKSTIPIGFTKNVCKIYPNLSIVFVPEFLREGNAIEDNLRPTRIVIGAKDKIAKSIAKIFLRIAKNTPEVFYMSSSEAEAVKLFTNSYLATRVSFFNELDSFALERNLNTKNIIDGVSSDPRVGKGYNNPSFGYGGYCLPKDTKQLLANFENIPQGIFGAVIESNSLRKEFIASKILEKNPSIVGVYRLVMKKGSDNFRESAMFDVIEHLKASGLDLLLYEPLIREDDTNFIVTHDLDYFKMTSDLIIANRFEEELLNVSHKIFTRDLFGEN